MSCSGQRNLLQVRLPPTPELERDAQRDVRTLRLLYHISSGVALPSFTRISALKVSNGLLKIDGIMAIRQQIAYEKERERDKLGASTYEDTRVCHTT